MYSPDMTVYGQTLHMWDPREYEIKCGSQATGDKFIGLLRPKKGRSPTFHSHPKLSQIIMLPTMGSSVPSL